MIHIAFCCDNNYLQFCATVIASVLHNNEEERIVFHIIGDGFEETRARQIKDLLIKDNHLISIDFHVIDRECFEQFPLGGGYVNISTYYRLALPEILPNVEKVLYLDCDVIVNDRIRDLWNTNLGDKAMAGVLDRHSCSIHLYNRLGYSMEYGYINAGVLLINLNKWREENILQKALELAKQKPHNLKNHDQDILNIIFYDQKIILDFKYNLLEYYLYVEEWLNMDRKYYPRIIEACKHPVIIHFCMPVKPWHYECINPFKSLYYKYRAMTPWPELELTHRKEKLTLKLKIKRLLGKIGLYHIEAKPTLRKDIDVIEDPDNVLF